jgi:hypothetical protein
MLRPFVMYPLPLGRTEQVGTAVKLSTRIREAFWSNLVLMAILTEVFHGFLQSLHENSEILPRLDHGRFLPIPFQIIVHHSSIRSHTV